MKSILSEFEEINNSDSFRYIPNHYLFIFNENNETSLSGQDDRIFQVFKNDIINSIRSSFIKMYLLLLLLFIYIYYIELKKYFLIYQK